MASARFGLGVSRCGFSGLIRRGWLRTTWAVLALVAAPASFAQVCAIPGADGPAAASGVLNTYYPGAATAAAGATSISVGAGRGSTAIAAGDLLLVIQMQDAAINSSNTGAYGDGAPGDPATGATSFGTAGRYEFAVAAGAVPLGGGTITLRGPLTNAYLQSPASLLQGRQTFQVVRVPQYSNLTVTSLLTALPWDGGSGGIVTLDVAGSLTFSGAGGVNVMGLGFRGGWGELRVANDGSGTLLRLPYVSTYADVLHAAKGEGVAGTPRRVNFDADLSTLDPGVAVDSGAEGYPNGDLSRGAPGNAGGGGADIDNGLHDNGGGGGGANGGAGGRGGIGWASSPAFYVVELGGFGGAPFAPAGAARLALGGGGGAGATNGNNPAVEYASGASGGGVVMIRAGTIAGAWSINADGMAAPQQAGNDGAGAGGAGGSVLVVTQAGSVGTLAVSAKGGKGGDSFPTGIPHGPGAGGGGGVVLLSGAASVDVSGGVNGVTGDGAGGTIAHGATAGGVGVTGTVLASGDAPLATAGARCLPVLTATKTTSTATRAQGVDTTASYTISISNASGRGAATGVSVTDDLPAPFTYNGAAIVPSYLPASCGVGPASVTGAGADPVVLGTPGGGASSAFTIPGGCALQLTFTSNLNSAANGTYQNPGTFVFADPTRATGGTAVAGGNPTVAPGGAYALGGTVGGSPYLSASSTAEDVTVLPPGADLSLTNVVSPLSTTVGATVTFTVSLNNAGPQTANAVAVAAPLPTSLTFVSATPSVGTFTPGTGVWSVGSIASGVTQTLTIVATVGATGPYGLTAQVTASDQSDPDSTPNNGVVGEDDQATAAPGLGSADLSLAKTVLPVSSAIGGSVTFTVSLANAGPDAASNVTVRDLLPTGYTFVSAAPSTGTYDSGTGLWTVGSVANASGATLAITATVRASGSYTNTAEVSGSNQSDPDSTPGNGNPAEDDQASATPTVTGTVPIIAVAKAATVTPVSAGVFDVAYTLLLRNLSGASTAFDAQVSDSLAATFPGPATFAVQAAPVATGGGLVGNPGFTGSGVNSLLNGTADLAPNGTSTITFTVRVTTNGAGGPFNNTATATAATVDGGPVTTTDLSDNGLNVDANNNGNPNEAGENDPTPVTLGGTVTGRVFIDSNGNGVQDGAESGAPAAQVTVTVGSIAQTVSTNGSGDWTAPNVPAGTATLDVQEATLPVGAALTTTGSDPSTAAVTNGISVSAGADGYQLQGTLDITVFSDTNSNGVRDPGEPGIAAVPVQINESDGTVRAVTTGPAGTVATGVPAGATIVDVQDNALPAGSTLSFGTDPTTVVVTAGATSTDINGYRGPGTVTVTVYNDANGNGVQDIGEPGSPNVQVRITDSAGAPRLVTTGPTGTVSVSVPAGATQIDVQEASLPAGALLTGGTDPTTVTAVAGADVADVNGYQQRSELQVVVFNDLNGNGTREVAEPALPGVQVLVTDSLGVPRTLTTNAQGVAAVPLPPGAATVDIVDATLPAGAALTGGTDPTPLTIVAGVPALDLNGYQVRGTVTGRVFRDSNGNRVQDAGEPGLANQSVTITTSLGTTLTPVTNATGDYSIVLPVGATVTRVADPAGLALTTGNNPQSLTVAGGAVAAAAPIGFAPVATVSGSVWRDLNSDRIRGSGETGLAGWRVELTNPATGVAVASATTDATGTYSVPNVVPAVTYRLRFVAPNGAVWGTAVNGESSNPQPNSVLNAAFRSLDITPQPGVTLVQQSLPVDPQGVVYDTLTRQAVPGARVTLTGPSGFAPATQLLGGASNTTQTTAADGNYQFLLLPSAPAGLYALTIVPPTGYNAPSAFLPASGTLDPTGLGTNGVFRVQAQNAPPTTAQPTTYYLTLSLAPGDPDVINNHIPVDPSSLAGGAIRLVKRADRVTTVVGGLVSYTITVENTSNSRLPGMEIRDTTPAGFTYVEGSARLDGAATGLAVRGPRPLVFSAVDLNAGQRRTLRYVLRVSAGVVRGEYPNTAQPFILNRPIGNPDTARVTVTTDPTFDDTTVIGKVFDDQNGDGWQDPNETGIPGVRLATVEGLVAETDSFGRYHFAALDGGLMERGRNFIVKLDMASLPKGAEIMTENPKVMRVTPGLPGRFDFGVKLKRLPEPSKRIDLKIAEVYFLDTSAELLPQYRPLLKEVADRIAMGEKVVLAVKVAPPAPDSCGNACQLGRRRIDALKRELTRLIGPEGMQNVEIVADYTAAGGVARVQPREGLMIKLAQGLIALLVPAAHAQGAPLKDTSGCRFETCATQPVEVRARYPRTLSADYGRFWASEDPAAIDPRLAVEGPDRLPVKDGAISAEAAFALYTNYSLFVERYEVVVFAASDTDRMRPLASVPVPFLAGSLRNLLTARWDARGVKLRRGDALVYLARAYSKDGRVDQTGERRLPLVPEAEYSEQQRLVAKTSRALAEPAVAAGAAGGEGDTALRGRFVVLQPNFRSGAQKFRLTPRFPDLGAELSAGDRAQIDELIKSWLTVPNMRLSVTGHTSSTAITRRGQKIFKDNYALSEARAGAVAAYLKQQLGLADSQVVIAGKGPDEPIASNDDETGRSQNRRVEVEIQGDSGQVLAKLTLVDPVARVGVDAAGGLALAESAIGAGRPLAELGLDNSVTRAFSRKSLLGDLAGLDDETLQVLYGRNDLARRSIPVYGSRVRVAGAGIAESSAVRLDGQLVPIDLDGAIAYETIMPIGRRDLFLDVIPVAGDVWPVPLEVDVTGKHLFMVGLVDLTWQNNDLSGSIEPLSADDRYLKDSISEGRIAMYLKGKIRGKYLLTTQLDTTEEQLGDLVDNFSEKDKRRLFRSIDPDQYYPVYGDDSTSIQDTNSQGRLYARLDWDKSRALWGNFNTNFTGTEFSQYNRSLYGANLAWNGLDTTVLGESKTSLTAFASEAQTALGHDEFLGTGGSLYYLRHTDVVEGSAKARVEIVDRVTDRTLENVTLVEGVDYEIDELQGRLILAKPLSQIARRAAPDLIRENALDGNPVFLVMDYEYLPLNFDADSMSFGARGKRWFGDQIAVGGTWVDESRDTQNYRLAGADVTLQAGRGTYVKLEYAQTEATQSTRYFSNDGGLSFSALNALTSQSAADDRTGEAMGLEARMNLRERGLTGRDATVAAWWSRHDNEFAVARRDEGFEVERTGVEAIGSLSDRLRYALRASQISRGGVRPGTASDVDQVALQANWAFSDRDTVSGEVQYQKQESLATPTLESTVAAFEYRRTFSEQLEVFGVAQTALDEGGTNQDYDLLTLGARYDLSRRWTVDAEASTGDRGDGLAATLEYRLSERHSLYGTYTQSVDRTDDPLSSVSTLSSLPVFGSRDSGLDGAGSNFAIGSRWQISDQTRLFNEAQFSDSATYSGIGHVFGLEFAPRKGWRFGASLQKGDFAAQGGAVSRDAASLSVGYASQRLNWSSRLEFRDDSGLTEATQYLSSNRIDFKLRDSFRVLGKVNYSQTEQDTSRLNDGRLFFGQVGDARFAEASLGLAYRPTDNDRFNWLAKVTYLYDLSSYGQADFDPTSDGVANFAQSFRTDQKSTVGALEGIWRLSRRFDLTGKLARRQGEVRLDRSQGAWIDSTANFAAVRLSYEVLRAWDALVEYRWLETPDASSRRTGFLVGIDREIKRNFKLGVGYNFTDFSDDLTNLDYEFKGIYINAVGKY